MSIISFICILLVAVYLGTKVIKFVLGMGQSTSTREEKVSAFADFIESSLNGAADKASAAYDRAASLKPNMPSAPKIGTSHKLELGTDGVMRLRVQIKGTSVILEQHHGMVKATLMAGDKLRKLDAQEFALVCEQLTLQGQLKQPQLDAIQSFLKFAAHR